MNNYPFENLLIWGFDESQRQNEWISPTIDRLTAEGIVPSWNISGLKIDEQAEIAVRVGIGDEFSPWQSKYRMCAEGGATIKKDSAPQSASMENWTRFQFRIQLPTESVLHSAAITRIPNMKAAVKKEGHYIKPQELVVPPLCQCNEDTKKNQYPYVHEGKVGNLICSPTCLAMVYSYYGCNVPIVEVAQSVFDPTTRLYGVWALNTASVYRFIKGEAFVACGQSLYELGVEVGHGYPVIVSIAWEEGELKNASQPRSSGHLVVVTGFTDDGDVIVNDPNTEDLSAVRRIFNYGEFFRAWSRRSRACYIIRAKNT